MKQENVLVTGGAGYIGSTLVRLLLRAGYGVRVLDNLSFGGEALLGVMSHPNFEFIKGDIRNNEALENALDGMDHVCHLAAIVGDPACKLYEDDATAINGDASLNLYSLCLKKNIRRFIFASTCSNYGKMKEPGAFVHEESELRPVSHYARLKVNFEKFLLNQRDSQITQTVLRFSTVYGLSPRPRFDLTVNEFTRDALLKKELLIYGEQFWRPYCHVYDLANSVLTVLKAEKSKVSGNVFNVGDTAENYTKGMLVEEIRKQLPETCVQFVQKDEDPRDYRVDFAKIRAELDYKITRTVPEGIKEIRKAISDGFISNPYSSLYSNT